MLLLWSGIGLVIVFVFLVVLYTIWKMDILRDYHLMSGRADDQKNILSNQSEMDITMFPSPHQIVPTLFLSNSDPIQRHYGKLCCNINVLMSLVYNLYIYINVAYKDESQPIRFSRNDFPSNREDRTTISHVKHEGFSSIPESFIGKLKCKKKYHIN